MNKDVIELLGLFAEVSVGVVGFTAIVLAVRGGNHSNFSLRDSRIFNGMLTHGFEALTFSLLPMVFLIFLEDPTNIWLIMSALLGGLTSLHLGAIVVLEWQRGWGVRILASLETCIGIFILLNLFCNWFPVESLYPLGVFVHVFQVFFLFVFLMYIPYSKVIGSDSEKEE